ncbi:hypothetical protein V5N11_007077 [Cardamine amara subsp. amara]|uniref:Zinc knuckle CX2CX4HX4C domain-containing protein n=1 Tax=Cardamine amara subsp. amara TaxID=228776 RepID=A0ABD1ALM3_CARAN
MSMNISLPTGEFTFVNFKYEKLEKQCFTCFMLTHEEKDCPIKNQSQNSPRKLGVNQLNTLQRLEEDKRRQETRRPLATTHSSPRPLSSQFDMLKLSLQATLSN